jgi:hypothetical protein
VTGCAATLVDDDVKNIAFFRLVVTKAFDAPAFKRICGTNAERVSELGVKTLSSLPKRFTFGVDCIVAAGWPKSLVGVGILDVDPTNGVVIGIV